LIEIGSRCTIRLLELHFLDRVRVNVHREHCCCSGELVHSLATSVAAAVNYIIRHLGHRSVELECVGSGVWVDHVHWAISSTIQVQPRRATAHATTHEAAARRSQTESAEAAGEAEARRLASARLFSARLARLASVHEASLGFGRGQPSRGQPRLRMPGWPRHPKKGSLASSASLGPEAAASETQAGKSEARLAYL
jgi:hypothetical protein